MHVILRKLYPLLSPESGWNQVNLKVVAVWIGLGNRTKQTDFVATTLDVLQPPQEHASPQRECLYARLLCVFAVRFRILRFFVEKTGSIRWIGVGTFG